MLKHKSQEKTCIENRKDIYKGTKGRWPMEKKQTKRTVSFRIDPELFKQFRLLCVRQDRKLTDLLVEGMEAMVKKYEEAE